MNDSDLIARYNYDSFVPANFEPWMNFERSPVLGTRNEDFPLWDLEGNEARLSEIVREYAYTVVEFGSFT